MFSSNNAVAQGWGCIGHNVETGQRVGGGLGCRPTFMERNGFGRLCTIPSAPAGYTGEWGSREIAMERGGALCPNGVEVTSSAPIECLVTWGEADPHPSSCFNYTWYHRCVDIPRSFCWCRPDGRVACNDDAPWQSVQECRQNEPYHPGGPCREGSSQNTGFGVAVGEVPAQCCPDCPPVPAGAPPGAVVVTAPATCPTGWRIHESSTAQINQNRPDACPECRVCYEIVPCECPLPETPNRWIRENRIVSRTDTDVCGTNEIIGDLQIFCDSHSCGTCEPEECPIDDYDFDVATPVVEGQEGPPCPPGQRVREVHQYGSTNPRYCGLCELIPPEELCPPEFSRQEAIPPGRSAGQVAQQACESMGGDNPWTLRAGWTTAPRPPATPNLVCFDCDPPPVCVCPPHMHQTPEAACAAYPPEHNPRPIQRLVPAVSVPPRSPDPCNRQRVPCYECRSTPPTQRDNEPCEPFVHARTRAAGYIVSDPDGLAQTIWTQDGSMRCGFPIGGLADAVLDGATRPGSVFGGTDPLTFADIDLTITPDPGATLLRRAQAGISSVGLYSFINLPWNNFGSPASDPPPPNAPGYTITLHINNRQGGGAVAEDQIGTWVCSCPRGLNDDPFTCQYEGLEVPKPDSTCPGIGGVNTNPPQRQNHPFNPPVGPWGEGRYGAFTRGAENTLIPPFGDRQYITNMDCRNPAANFFLTVWDTSNAPWWQAAAGNVYADQNIISNIPAQTSIMDQGGDQDYTRCVFPHCSPFIIRDNNVCDASTGNSPNAGYPIIGGRVAGGNINAGTMGGNITARGGTGGSTQNSRVVSSLHGPREDFAHFYGLMPSGFNSNTNTGLVSLNISTLNNVSQLSVCNGENVACIVRGNLTIGNGTNITVPSGAKHSVFVTGDLNIGDPGVLCLDAACYMTDYIVNMYVEQGGWLGFIVQGNINVAPSVGRFNKRLTSFSGGDMRFDTTRPVCFGTDAYCDTHGEGNRQPCNNNERGTVQGVFFADGAININRNPDGQGLSRVGSQICANPRSRIPDKKFIGEGTFVGWSGVNLLRDFNDHCSFTQAWNSRSPTESFIYRPDFLLNVPDWMRRSLRLRQETL